MSADPFIAQLAALCREQQTRAKWVFVPTHAVGLSIGDRLAREGTSWVNLHFVTPLDVAIPMAAPFLLERGIDPSEEPLGPPLIMRLLLDLPLEGGYFRPMAEHASMAQALWSTIRELRFAGLEADVLPPAAFRSPAKARELATLIRAFERHLVDAGSADMSVVFEEAPKHLDVCPIRTGDVWTELPETVWAPLVRRFLDCLPGAHEPGRTLEVELPVPRRVLALAGPTVRVSSRDLTPILPASSAPRAAGTETPRPGTAGAQFQLPFLSEEAEEPGPGATVHIFRAGGHEAEIDEIVRRILASGRRLDEVEIVCASEMHALVAWEKARRLDWPVTISAGIPAGMTRAGRALLAWCTWIEGGFGAGDLRRMLESGDLTLGQEHGRARSPSAPSPATCDDVACTAQQAAKILLRAKATWGRATYRASLSGYAAHQEQRAAERGADEAWRVKRAAQSRWLIRILDDLLEPIPDSGEDGRVAVAALLDAAQRFTGKYTRRSSDLDAAGQLAVLDSIQALRALDNVRGPLVWALRFLTDAIASARVGRSRSKPEHVHVSLFTDPGFDARPLSFVCGLEEARVFPAAVEDPVLLDSEREAVDVATGSQALLRTSGDRVDEAVYAGLVRLARLGAGSREVVLSFSSIDTRDFREAFPSWLVLRAYRAASGDPRAGYRELRKAIGEPVSVVPATWAAAPTTAAWWLRAGRSGAAAVEPVRMAYPDVARGVVALSARDSEAFTEFDGYAPEAGRLLDPSRNDMVVSATLLESAADCPFRFFLETGLGIEPLDEDEADADVWLDPLRRGSELHALYAELLRRARTGKRRVSQTHDLAWFLERGQSRLLELRRELPPPSEEVAARETADLLEDLRLFVKAEEADRGIEPVAFEVSFGRPLGGDGEVLGSPEPVTIALGRKRTLTVAGRIDRIDRLRSDPDAGSSHQAGYRIVDYKTGRFRPTDYEGTFRRGTLLQHALYGVAAARLVGTADTGAAIVEGVYWHPTSRGWGRRARIPAPSPGQLQTALTRLCDLLGGGVFIQAPERKERGQRFTKNACRYCDFAAACGTTPAPLATRKAEANVDGRLAPWLALQEVE